MQGLLPRASMTCTPQGTYSFNQQEHSGCFHISATVNEAAVHKKYSYLVQMLILLVGHQVMGPLTHPVDTISWRICLLLPRKSESFFFYLPKVCNDFCFHFTFSQTLLLCRVSLWVLQLFVRINILQLHSRSKAFQKSQGNFDLEKYKGRDLISSMLHECNKPFIAKLYYKKPTMSLLLPWDICTL